MARHHGIDLFEPAHRMAERIRNREILALALTEAHLEQITRCNGQLNAICTVDEAGAREHAAAADEALARGENWGPLHGVPVTIKDLFETTGLRTTAGELSLSDYMPSRDAIAVARLRHAGAIILGKTNGPNAGGDYQSANPIFGRSSNPWNLERTPGGSSGGGAAAVAAGLSGLDLCSDIGGSIRQPAHFCGVYGLKPTDRRVSTDGHLPPWPGQPQSIRQMLTVGAIARSITDLELALRLIAGSDSHQPDIPPVPLATAEPKALADLNLAWSDGLEPLLPMAAIRQGIQTAVQQLGSAGAKLTTWQPSWDWPQLLRTYYRLSIYNIRFAQTPTARALRHTVSWLWRERISSDRLLRQYSVLNALPALLRPSLQDYFKVLTERDRWVAWMDEAIAPYDALLLPVAMTTAFPHLPSGTAIAIEGTRVPYSVASGAYLQPFNLSGHPVVVVPIGQTPIGLPIGLQIVGKRWQDSALLAIAKSIDAVK